MISEIEINWFLIKLVFVKYNNGELIWRVNSFWVLVVIGYWFMLLKILVFDNLFKVLIVGCIEFKIIFVNDIFIYIYLNKYV